MFTALPLLLLGACSSPAPATLPDVAPPPFGALTLSADPAAYQGEPLHLNVTGAHPGETVYLVRSRTGSGAGPCYAFLGGQCAGLLPPLVKAASVSADLTGEATFELPITAAAVVGQTLHFQAITIRGLHGADTILSGATSVPISIHDMDGDGVEDSVDPCPTDNPDDSDADGVCASADLCPGADDALNTDGDAAPDCLETCPADPAKLTPGACGCGTPDTDADDDGAPGCTDPCPLDADDDLDADGVCGDVDPCPADNPDDSDGDGVCNTDDVCAAGDDNVDLNNDGRPDACPFDGADCQGILAANPAATTGAYIIDPDGAGSVAPFEVWCDMTHNGGGWTLVLVRTRSAVTTHRTQLLTPSTTAQALTNERWAALSAASTETLGTEPDFDPAYVADLAPMRTASCHPLATDLTSPIIAHHENAGCNSVGTDYSLWFGQGATLELSENTLCYNRSTPAFWSPGLTSGYRPTTGLMFVR